LKRRHAATPLAFATALCSNAFLFGRWVGVMKWMRERDLLIAQTMAFVQSVTGKKPDGERPVAFSATTSDLPAASPIMPDIEAMLAEAIGNPEPPPKPLQISRPVLRSEYQNEIQARVANFRAHQQRFLKEREDYCSTTMAKVQKALNNLPPPRISK
jgi:hypothetical protein